LFRPLVVVTLVAAVAFVLIGGATRRWHLAAFAVALAMLAIGAAVLVFPLAAVWGFLTWRSMKQGGSWDATSRLTRPMNVLVGVWFVLATAVALAVSLPRDIPVTGHVSVQPGPNLYLILLDGYPRADTLQNYFNFDNRPFLDALEIRGFEVAERGGSHYPSTIQTVPTMMHMRPLKELLREEWDGSDAQYRRLWHLLNAAPVPAAYHAAGYTTYSIVSPAAALDWRTADVVLESPWLSNFESHFVSNGILRSVLQLDTMHGAAILDAFTYLEASAGESPRFVFAHIFSPHNPYVFAADGGPAKPCGHECTNHAGPPNPTLADRLIGQLRFLNGRVLAALDHIIAVDPDGIVIVFSDHGLRRDRADMDEWFRTLFAARGHSFPDDVTPLDLFPTLLGNPTR
jgi:hypothetical protein